MHVAAKGGMGRYVRIVPDDALMVDGRAGVDNAMPAYTGIGLDYSPLHHNRTFAYTRRRTYDVFEPIDTISGPCTSASPAASTGTPWMAAHRGLSS